jgi:hypothetical protein
VAARLILALLLSGCVGGGARTPTGVVERFYELRIDSEMSGAPTPDEFEAIEPYLTPELHGLLEEAGKQRDLEAAAAPDEKPAFADGDLFSSLFEGPTAFRVVGERPRGDARRVAVRFTSRHGPESVSWEDTVVVVPQDGDWAIADVEYSGSWEFASRGTLKSNLRRALDRPRAACHALVPTTWVVTGHTAPGIAAMSDDEAEAWHGDELTITREQLTFRDDDCEPPTFANRELSRAKFEDEFGVPADELRLAPGAICVTEVACPDGPMPGTLLVHGRNELLLLWDGVWFQMRRRQ